MEPAKFCTECGAPLPPEAKRCPNCGAEVAELHPTPSDGVQQIPPPQEPVPQPVGSGPYGAALAPPPGMPTFQPGQAAPYGGLARRPGAHMAVLLWVLWYIPRQPQQVHAFSACAASDRPNDWAGALLPFSVVWLCWRRRASS